jgi:hypothetical protein
MELPYPGMQADEWKAVRGQDERIGRQIGKAVDRIQEAPNGVIERCRSGHSDIGGDARQQHVARDQYAQFGAVKGDVLWRMALSDDTAPGVRVDADDIPVGEPMVMLRQARHAPAIDVAAGGKFAKAGRVQPVYAKVRQHGVDAVGAERVVEGMREQKLAGRHPHRRMVLL